MKRTLSAIVAVAASVLSACSIQSDSAPREISDEKARELRPPEPQAQGGPATGNERIYLIAPGPPELLRTVARDIEGSDANELLDVLFDGVNDVESRDGYTSAIPPDATLNSARVSGNVVTVDIGSERIAELPPSDLVLAVAQIVYTANQLVSNARVVLRVDGDPRSWPDAATRQQSRPLTIYDYYGLAESSQPAYPAQVTPVTPPNTVTPSADGSTAPNGSEAATTTVATSIPASSAPTTESSAPTTPAP